MTRLKKSFVEAWKHAFAVSAMEDTADAPALPPSLERLAQLVVERRLETPAIIFLESVRPLSFLGSQAGHAFLPLIQMLGVKDSKELVTALEDRRTLRRLVERIEELTACR